LQNLSSGKIYETKYLEIKLLTKKTNVMKKLFLTSLLCMFLGTAVAQESPRKKKDAKSTSDTIAKKRRDNTATQKNSASYKRDTINDHKNKTNKSGTDNSTMDRRKDSVSNMPKP